MNIGGDWFDVNYRGTIGFDTLPIVVYSYPIESL